MARVYCQVTKITNAVGRSQYIKNETHKQEEVIFHKENMEYDWSFYHEYELAHQHNPSQKQNEAREIMFPLPNELASKIKGETKETQIQKIEGICDEVIHEMIGEKHDYEYAVHWNKARTNLHCHVMFSEREVVDLSVLEQKKYKKDIWKDPDTGKLCKKGIGVLVHKKGDLMFKDGVPVYSNEPLSPKDTRFKSKSFMVQRDLAYQKVMGKWGYDFEINNNESPYLSQKKLYKGASQDYIKKAEKWNQEVKRYNEAVKEHIRLEPQIEPKYKEIKKDIQANVKEVNTSAKRITIKAIEMVKSMADYVENIITKLSHRVEKTVETLENWWENNRDNLMQLHQNKHVLRETGEMLKKMEQIEESRYENLEREYEKTAESEMIKSDCEEYQIDFSVARKLSKYPGEKDTIIGLSEQVQALELEPNTYTTSYKCAVINLILDNPQELVDYISSNYTKSMYRQVKPIWLELEGLHGNNIELPRLQRNISRGYGLGL